jgi:KipI family sensor histidine kinase inhibitor
MDNTRYLVAGERGITVEFGESIDESINLKVMQLYRCLIRKSPSWLMEAVPTYRSLLVVFNPELIDGIAVTLEIGRLLETPDDVSTVSTRSVTIPVWYGGEAGPDLQDVADWCKMTPDEVIQIHCQPEYRVYMLGFTPGFPYLGGMDQRISVPRLDDPRTKIPAGSVGIAGPQTGVYPIDSPGGWRLIGRTPQVLFDPENDHPSYLLPGDRVRFKSIDSAAYERLALPPKIPGPVEVVSGIEAAKVRKGGFLTTVQDMGRWGYQCLGVPVSGVMDPWAAMIANELCGNEASLAVLEVTMGGLELEWTETSVIAITGGDMNPMINGIEVSNWCTLQMKRGDILSFGGRRTGCRTYIAVSGGFSVKSLMGSASTYLRGRFGGVEGRALQAGDTLRRGHEQPWIHEKAPEWVQSYIQDIQPIPVVLGLQDDYFHRSSLATLTDNEYRVSPQADRMGYRMEGPLLEHQKSADIISDGIPPGAIQVPGHGSPIIMMADRQTTGGYPKLGCVTWAGICRLAQRMPGDYVRFIYVTPQQAVEEYRTRLKQWQQWRGGHRISKSSVLYRWRVTVEQTVFDVVITDAGESW